MSFKTWGHSHHQFLKKMRQLGFDSESKAARFVLAISGGVDSAVLLQFFSQVMPWESWRVIHFHHGCCSEDKKEQELYRDKAAELVSRQVKNLISEKLPILTESEFDKHFRAKFKIEKYHGPVLTSEEELRSARESFFLRNIRHEEVLVLAHHQDDELETRLLRLIRGAGVAGFLSFSELGDRRIRPLLDFPKSQLVEFAQSQTLTWLEDPSNRESVYLRNWLRREWLPQLESKIPGGCNSLYRSLDNIHEALSELQDRDEADFLGSVSLLPQSSPELVSEVGFSLSYFMTFSSHKRRRWIAHLLLKLNIKNFSRGQIEEILKHLDKDEKVHSFRVASCQWSINAGQVLVGKHP